MRTWMFVLLLFAYWAEAGELVFHNQDVLKGEIVAINPDHLIWGSEAIGHVTIPKQSVASMFTALPLKRIGVDEVCYWIELDGLDALLQCEGDEIERITFASLDNIIVHASYANMAHKYEGRLVGVGTQSEGNRNRQDWLVDINVTLRHYEYRHIVGLKYAAEQIEERALQEEFEAAYTLDWFFARRTFLFAKSSASRDESREIDARYSLGSGLGYQLFDTANAALSVETGGEYVYERVIEPNTDTEGFFSWRLATSFRYMLPLNIAFYLNADYLQSVDAGEDWEVESEAGISMPIAMGMTADIKYEYDYDNTPQDALRAADSTLRVGFGYQW